ncbi:hypothetical protein [Thalassobacillus sp. C254]|uniref:hypothetical protein n=1 Tax=Thalassobacillus sp. C254 TaxID=1225341 RepID=UPI0006D1BF83|nr:hypothetical protein [Thalassobacillus sp. C254]
MASLLSERVNVISSLGLTYKEDIVSNLLVALLNHSVSLIENKLRAEEGTEQTLRYASRQCVDEVKRDPRIGILQKEVKEHFAFLTLVPESSVSSDQFRQVTYQEILQDVDIEDIGLRILYEDFVGNVRQFYLDAKIQDNDFLIKAFSEETEGEVLETRFRQLMDSY